MSRIVAKFRVYGELILACPDGEVARRDLILDRAKAAVQQLSDRETIDTLDLSDRSIWAIDDAETETTLFEE